MSFIPNPAKVLNGLQKAGIATAKCNQNCIACFCKKYNLQFHFTDDDNIPYSNMEYIAYFEDGTTKKGITCKNGYTEVFRKTKKEKIDIHLNTENNTNNSISKEQTEQNEQNEQTKPKKTTQGNYSIEKAVNYVNSHAASGSKGLCALYVRKAINAGGISGLSGNATDYYDTDKLVNFGFTKIGTDINSIQLKKGDIAAFAAVKGHKFGHLAMYNGTQWVSDFKQKSFWVASQYSVDKKYAIYRWED